MRKTRTLVMLPLTDEQRALLKPLLDAVEDTNAKGTDAAIFAQAWSDGIVATLVSGDEVSGVQAVLKPEKPWSGHPSAEARMRSHRIATCLDEADLSHL